MRRCDGTLVIGPRLRAARRALVIAVTALGLLVAARPAQAQEIREDFWVTDGSVAAIALSPSGEILYIGGSFTQVGPATGGWVPIDAATSLPVGTFPHVAGGVVMAAAPDGQGGWYIGGAFTAVGGIARSHIARILSDGTLSDWNPNASGYVYDLAVSGSKVYVGGDFTSIGGHARNSIAALDAATGEATGWDPDCDNTVDALAVSGPVVYAGGYFTSIGGQARNNIAALDAATGEATDWDPNADFTVLTLVASGSTVYAGGSFTSIGGQTRNRIAALDSTTGAATAWNPNAQDAAGVFALAVSGSTVYAGGYFANIGGQARSNIAALNAVTGAATAWDPGCNDQVRALAVSGSTVYAGGYFTSVGGQARNRLAALDAASGAATGWDPNCNDSVHALAVSGSTVYAGGYFGSVGGEARNNIAALDATTGAATGWNPNADSYVSAIALSGSTAYVGGDFTDIGGQTRNRVAALDTATGAATPWDPRADGLVCALAVSGSTVYAGGYFANIGGQARNNIAALDAATGAATAWDPDCNDQVRALAVSGSMVYAGGDFTGIGGQTRNMIAALDAATGAATAWDPSANDLVHALVVSGSTVYAGGDFTGIGGQARSRIAALNAATGAATAWDPNGNESVRALAVSGTTVYAGGLFRNIGGQERNRIAALDAVTGAATAWDPNASSTVSVLAARASAVYAGGHFPCMSLLPRRGIAGFGTTSQPVCEVSPSALDFGNVYVGGHADRSFIVRNAGPWDCYSLTGAVSESCDDYLVTSGSGAFSLAAGESLTVTVRFSPIAEGTSICAIETGAALCSDVECRGDGVPPLFTNVGGGLPGAGRGSVDWGDYDNDGDLDILFTGTTDNSSGFSAVYRNDGGVFSDIGAVLPGVLHSSVDWGDYDNDGDLDILLTGVSDVTLQTPMTRIYRNSGGVFSDIGAGLPGVGYGSASWGDCDNDGDLDVLLAGSTGVEGIARVYRNVAGAFVDTAAGLEGVYLSSAAWGDYDNDGDLDILLAGYVGPGQRTTRVYRNHQGSFTDIGAGLPGLFMGSVAWGDYDSDGDLDILLTGSDGAQAVSRIYRNEGGGSFDDIGAGLPGVYTSAVAWGDCDNDGDLDILLTGFTGSQVISRVYSNDAGVFTDVGAGLSPLDDSSAAWGDYDNDGDLDILLTGDFVSNQSVIYRNNSTTANTPPSAPTNLAAAHHGSTATFSWDAAADGQTPSPGLTYNLRVGTTPGGSDVMSPMAAAATGYRRVAQLGNTNHRTSWTIAVPELPYYWSVQAVDAAFAGSAFAAEDTARAFTRVAAGLPGVRDGAVAWGDYDGDGDLDLLLAGMASARMSVVYRNDGGVLTDIGAGLIGVYRCSAAWGDYDGDGDLDILLAGYTGSGQVARVYRNDGGVFTSIAALTGVYYCSVAWGDYDNDGDLDILLTGFSGTARISRVYRNDSGVFTDIVAGLAGVYYCSVAWGDYDNDGDLDILLAGSTGAGSISKVYRNDGGVFTDVGAGLVGVSLCGVAWGDCDNDGDLDILLAGSTGSGVISRVYRNDGGIFADVGAGFTGVSSGSVAWGDYDNDGDFDAFISGYTGTTQTSRVYRNNGGSFSSINAGLRGVFYAAAAWGDYDNDADLDILLSGQDSGGQRCSIIYRNNTATPNTPPARPMGLLAQIEGTTATFSWDAATDFETPSPALTYNLRVGTTPGGSEIMSATADPGTGYRRVARLGNVNHMTSWTVEAPQAPPYYWSVQAVDASFAGSGFHSEAVVSGSFTDINAGLIEAYGGDVAWGDYDSDGDLDFLLTGVSSEPEPDTHLYRWDGGVFTDVEAGLPWVGTESCVAWGDYDGDNDLDIAMTGFGSQGSTTGEAYVFRNDNGVFTDIAAPFPPAGGGAVAWGDCDGDGDLDLFLSGSSSSGMGSWTCGIWRNDAGVFADIEAGFPAIIGSAAWGDYDNDADMDLLLLSGDDCRLYRNDGGAFADAGAGLPRLDGGSCAWGDYDSDGDPDLLLAGRLEDAGPLVARVYRNDGGLFTDVAAGLPGVYNGSVAWGDSDNDGDLDALLAGQSAWDPYTVITRVYENDAGAFADAGAGLAGVSSGAVAWGDFDNDGDLDVLLTGHDGYGGTARVYRSNAAVPNTPPAAPTNLLAEVQDATASFRWDAATDGQTPAAGLTYNLRVGTTPGGCEIMSAMADSGTGHRLVPQPGNTRHSTSWVIDLPEAPHYYWSVQAVDNSFAGSVFASGDFMTGVAEPEIPSRFALYPNVPNPFNPTTTIRYDLPQGCAVALKIFDAAGRLVRVLRDGARERADAHAAVWDGRDDSGHRVASGTYFVRLEAAGEVRTLKVMVVR